MTGPVVALLSAVLLVAGALLGGAPLVLLGLVLASATALSARVPRGLAVPLAVAGLALLAVLVGSAAAAVHLPLLRAPAALAVVALACLTWCARSQPAPLRTSASAPAAQLPAVVALAVAALQALDVRRVIGWSARGTDFLEHTVLLGALRTAGELSYGTEAYPRAVHALLVLGSSASAPAQGSAALLDHDLRLLAWATWAALALLLSVAATVVRAVALRCGASPAAATWAAALTGLALLQWGTFLSVFLSMASAPGLVTVVVLTLPVLTACLWPGVWPCTAVTAVATVLVAHLWPALLPVVGTAWLAVAAGGEQRAALLRACRSRGAVLLALPALLVLAVVVVQPLLGLLDHGGFAIADIDGGLPAAPVLLPALAGAGALAAAARRPRSSGSRALAGTTLGLAITVAVLAANVQPRWDLGQYYPTKGLWFAAIVLAPWAAGGLTRPAAALLTRAWALVAARGLVPRALAVLLPLALAVAYVLPVLAVQGSHAYTASLHANALEQRRLQVAQTYADAFLPAVTVPVAVGLQRVPESHDSYLVAKLMRHRTGQPQTFGRLQDACGAVRDVAAGRPAVVITDLRVAEMRDVLRRQGCPGVRVVQAPGADPTALEIVRNGARLGAD